MNWRNLVAALVAVALGALAWRTGRWAGLIFLVVVPASALLFVFAPHVEASRRRYFLAAAWSGAIGTFGAFMLFKPLCEEYEAIVLFYLAMLVATLMLVLMGLSGFREK